MRLSPISLTFAEEQRFAGCQCTIYRLSVPILCTGGWYDRDNILEWFGRGQWWTQSLSRVAKKRRKCTTTDLKRKRVLIVEDTDAVRLTMKLWLVAAGYEVDLASDGREALERVKAEPPDLVLLDLMMPDVTGYVVCRQMREFEKTKRTPIIVITALPTAADSNEARMSGADEVMVKPVEEMQVLQKIRHYLGASVFK